MADDTDKFVEDYLSGIWTEDGNPGLTGKAIAKYHGAKDLCQSPIERMMLGGLIATPFGYGIGENIIIPAAEIESADAASPVNNYIVPQMQIPQFRYRTDFFVSLATNGYRRLGMFIECDGHDWHEKNKEQAARDRKRDRDLQSLGVNVLRFTGSEIFSNFDECMNQIDMFGSDLIEKEWVSGGREVWGFAGRQRRLSIGKLIG